MQQFASCIFLPLYSTAVAISLGTYFKKQVQLELMMFIQNLFKFLGSHGKQIQCNNYSLVFYLYSLIENIKCSNAKTVARRSTVGSIKICQLSFSKV